MHGVFEQAPCQFRVPLHGLEDLAVVHGPLGALGPAFVECFLKAQSQTDSRTTELAGNGDETGILHSLRAQGILQFQQAGLATVEELGSANQELLAANEELRAAKDDLGRLVSLEVGKIPSGFRIRTRGADMKVHVRTPRQAELAKLMPEKLPPDTSKFLLCPMPGVVVKISVEEGQEVQEGQALATVEAMKMENILRAEKKGVVKKIAAEAGASLKVDEVIMEFE